MARRPTGRAGPADASTTLRRERPGRALASALVRGGAAVLAWVLGRVASLRRAPALHPVGSLHRASVVIDGGDHVLTRLAGRADAAVRLSRGGGLPHPLPDVLGLAVRIEVDDPLDLLLSSSGRGRLTRHLLVPGRDPGRPHYSSLAPYADDLGRRFVIGAAPVPASDPLCFRLEVAAPGAPWEHVGEVALTGILAAEDRGEVAFDPWRCPPWMRPAGALNDLRRPAYGASQAARRRHRRHDA
jgi:hypothetical protein